MLPTSLVRVRFNRNRVAPQYLDASHATWIDLAEQVLGIFQTATNITRGELEEELEEVSRCRGSKRRLALFDVLTVRFQFPWSQYLLGFG